jgi:DNA invertase Pin-like site-specific DNA recombinase
MAAVVGYARVSKDEQADALPAQVARLEAAGCLRVITDIESGREDDRDGLLEVMAMVRAGEVSEVLVTRVDRLGRNAAFADALLAQCEAAGVTIRALDGGVVETATPQGFLMARLQTGLAEMESRMLSMRIRRQFVVYRAEGRHLRRRKPFGYQGGKDHRLEPHPTQWSEALRILEQLRLVGSFSGVASRLPDWCSWTPAPGSLQAWFCSPVIRGHLCHGYDRSSGKGWNMRWAEIRYDQHPALISELDWRELADLLRRPRNRFKACSSTETQHGLTGLLRCASCGHLLRRNSSAGVVWWRCRHRLCRTRGSAKEAVILPLVVDACVAEASRLAAAVSEPKGPDPMVAAMIDELEMMQRLAARNPDNKAMAAAVAEQQQRIQAARRVDRVAVDPAAYRALQDPHFFRQASPAQQRAMFSAVLQSVLVGVRGDPIEPQPRMS